jgi:predicted RNA-binding protein associated with RNAse of E/G family
MTHDRSIGTTAPDRQDDAMTASPQLFPSARQGDSSDVVDVHPPKIESFDVSAMTNVDPKGYVRAVDEYRVEPFGLYLARPMEGHSSLSYRESWLLPELGIQITDWHFHPGQERDQDFYIDIGLVQRGENTWHLVDLYLDVVLREGRGLDVVDTDELIGAMSSGLLDHRTGQAAFETTYRVVDQLAANGYRLADWLADLGIQLDWRRH